MRWRRRWPLEVAAVARRRPRHVREYPTDTGGPADYFSAMKWRLQAAPLPLLFESTAQGTRSGAALARAVPLRAALASFRDVAAGLVR